MMMLHCLLMAVALPTGCPDFAVELPEGSEKVSCVRASDFGFSVIGEKNAAAINAALAEAKRIGAKRVELAPGTYRCFDEDGVRIEGFRDFTFDGKGAVLVFRRPPEYRGQPQSEVMLEKGNVLVRRCERTMIANFTMDWDWESDPLAAFVKVADKHIDELHGENSYVDFEFVDYERYPKYPESVPIQKVLAMDECRTRFRNGGGWQGLGQTEGHFGPKNEWLKPNVLRVWPSVPMPGRNQNPATGFKLSPETNLRQVKKLKAEGVYRLQHCYYGKNGINLDANRHLTVKDVTVWSCFGMAMVIDGPQEYWQVENLKVRPPTAEEFAAAYPGKRFFERPISSTSDGHHVVRSKGHCRYLNCEWSRNNDDSSNFHDRFTIAVKCGARRLQIVNRRGYDYFRAQVGATLELRHPNFDSTGFSAHLVKVSGEVLELDADLPEQQGPCFLVWDRTYGTDNVIVKGCRFVDTAWRNVFSPSNLTIEDCTFLRMLGVPCHLIADYRADRWCEGMGSTNVVIRNCTFEDNCIGVPNGAQISTACVTPDKWEIPPPNKGFVGGDMLIEGCTFIRPRGPVLKLDTGRNVVFRNSTIDLRGEPQRESEEWVVTNGAENVRVENIQYLRDLPFDAELPGKIEERSGKGVDPVGAGEIVVEPPRSEEGSCVRASDFGFSVDNEKNAAAINAALAEAKRIGAKRIELAPGTYRCFNEPGVRMEGFTDFIFDGKGAVLVFRRPPTYPMLPSWDHDSNRANFIVRDCHRVRVGDFAMDWDWKTLPLATCSRVLAVHVDEENDNASYCDFELLGHGDRHALYGQPFPAQRTQPMSDDFKHFLKGPNWWHATYEGDVTVKTEWLSPTRVRIYPAVVDPALPHWDGPNERKFDAKMNRSWAKAMKVGDSVRIAHTYYGKGGFTLDSNSDFELHDVNIYACHGHAVYIDGTQTRWMMRNVSVAPRDWRHPISSTADAVHFVRSHGKAVIDNLTVKLEADDAINVHDRFTVAKRVGECELEVVLERGARYFKPGIGNKVELLDPGYNPLGWFGKVTKIEGERIVFDRPVPEGNDWLLVLDRTASSDGVIIRNCTFEDMEMRTLVNCSDATIENCRFIRTNGDALRCLADYTLTWWAEGMGATNIVIRNCWFDSNCVREMVGSYYSLGADFSTWLGRPEQVKPERLNRRFVSDILVEGCTFRDSLGYFADLRFGSDIVFRGNRIERTGKRAECRETSGSARLERVNGVRFENNVFVRPEGMSAPRLEIGEDVSGIVLRGNKYEIGKGDK